MVGGEVLTLESIIEIVVGTFAQERKRPAEDLVGGAIVDAQSPGPARDLDANLRQRPVST